MKTFNKLKTEYRNKGINLFYMRSGRKYALSIIDVPMVVQGIEHEKGTCQLTGYYTVYDKDSLQDVESISKEVFDAYKEEYTNNEIMLSYIQ